VAENAAELHISIICFCFRNRTFTEARHKATHTRCLEGKGGRRMDIWSIGWAAFAATAGLGLAVAAFNLWRGVAEISRLEFDGGYNALAPALRH
jgi:hypothetical protein